MTQHVDLATTYRQIYRAQFLDEVQAGNKRPFIVPLAFMGYYTIPALYLAIPHKNRPWLYQARWLVLAFTTIFNIKMIMEVSSQSFPIAYGAGLIGAWATIWNFTLLVWTRPQWDAKRVDRVRRTEKEPSDEKSGQGEIAQKPTVADTNGHATNGHAPGGLRERQPKANGNHALTTASLKEREQMETGHPDNSREFEYVWQEFPEDGSFFTRLDWAFDLASSFRMTGWNWAIRVLPSYELPPWSDDKVQESLSSIPNISKEGYTRSRTVGELVRERILFSIIPSYIILDICGAFVTQDPYFILGPNDLPLSPGLAALHPALLAAQRSALGFFGVLAGLHLYWNVGAVCVAIFLPPILGFRADPWHIPTMNGSFTEVLDKGLAGFWGSFWHQTFRFGFAAPTKWLIHNGYLRRGSVWSGIVGALVAFVLSGFVHASGSYSMIAESRPWEPPLFFVLSGVGTQLQQILSRALKPQIESMPRWVRRVTNLAFVVGWLHLSCGFLIDDFSRSGLFLFEPVPISFARMAGAGSHEDSWVRWNGEQFGELSIGKHWWEAGVRL